MQIGGEWDAVKAISRSRIACPELLARSRRARRASARLKAVGGGEGAGVETGAGMEAGAGGNGSAVAIAVRGRVEVPELRDGGEGGSEKLVREQEALAAARTKAKGKAKLYEQFLV